MQTLDRKADTDREGLMLGGWAASHTSFIHSSVFSVLTSQSTLTLSKLLGFIGNCKHFFFSASFFCVFHPSGCVVSSCGRQSGIFLPETGCQAEFSMTDH